MEMQDAAHLRSSGMDGAMDGKSGAVDWKFGISDNVALKIDLNQIRGGNFLECQAIRVQEEMLFGPGDPRGDVIVNQLVPAVALGQTIGGSELDADFPF